MYVITKKGKYLIDLYYCAQWTEDKAKAIQFKTRWGARLFLLRRWLFTSKVIEG